MLNEEPKARVLALEVENFDFDNFDRWRSEIPGSAPHKAADVTAAGKAWLLEMLSEEQCKAVAAFHDGPYEALHLSGLPFSTHVSTPPSGFLPNEECVLDFDLLHFGMLAIMGFTPYAVEYENEGKLVRNVVPVASAAGKASSWGADTDFTWHTDNPNWPFASDSARKDRSVPRYLAFVAVRNEEKASTDIASARAILHGLPDPTISELMRPAYVFHAPPSNEGFAGEGCLLPVIERDGELYRFRFDSGVVSPTDAGSSKALSILKEVVAKLDPMEVVLRPGDFFIFKNERVVHRRRAFRPLTDGRARWLRRLYAL